MLCFEFTNNHLNMGQSQPKEQPISQPTPEIIDKNIDLLFTQHMTCEKLQVINQPIIVITHDLALKGSFEKTSEGTKVNQTLLKCLYHPNFEATIKNLVCLLSKELKSILEAKIIAMVSREKFRKCLNAANFCIFFTDESLLQSINLLSIRSDLHPQSKSLVLEYTKEFAEINQSLLDTLGLQKLVQLCRIFRLSINLMIELHLKLLTRSDFTLKIVDRLIQSLFIMYVKVLLQNQEKDVSRRELTENAKSILRIGAYFIGLGLQAKSASVYELGVIVLQRLLALKGEQLKGQKALPSHLFKSLPVINNNQMMNWLSNNLLFALKYIKKDTNYFSRMNINRIPSLKLLTHIFEKFHPQSNQISYLLEQICLQTKTFQIERVFVCKLAQLYAKLSKTTDIINKYAQMSQINFNLKANTKQIKIKPEDVRTQLESDEESVRKEIVALCAKYTIQVIFQKPQVFYEYSDKSLWNTIISHLEEQGGVFKGEQQPIELNKEGEQEKV